MVEQPTLVNAETIKSEIETRKNSLITYFSNRTIFKTPANEAEDGTFLSVKDNLDYIAEIQNLSLSELCLLATQMFSRKNNSTIEPLPPILSDKNDIFENAIKIKNMIQYCNNILRYILKSRNIDIGDSNSLSELITYLPQIELLDSRDRVFTLNKDTYFSNEEILIQQKNILGAYRNYPIQYYNDEYYDTDYDIDSVNPSGSPKTLNFSKSLGVNTDIVFDKSLGNHKKIIKDYFNRKHYLSYTIVPPRDIVKKVEITNDGNLIVYFIPKNNLDNTVIATDFDINNNGDIVETDINIVDKNHLGDKGIENIWIDENDNICYLRNFSVTDIIISSDTPCVSLYHENSCTLTITVKSGDTFLKNYPITLYSSTGIEESLVTDNSGQATYTYNATGIGDVTFYASIENITSNDLIIEDCIYFNKGTITNDLMVSSGNITSENDTLIFTTTNNNRQTAMLPVYVIGSRIQKYLSDSVSTLKSLNPDDTIIFEANFVRTEGQSTGITLQNKIKGTIAFKYDFLYDTTEELVFAQPPSSQGKFTIQGYDTSGNGISEDINISPNASQNEQFKILTTNDKIKIITQAALRSLDFYVNNYLYKNYPPHLYVQGGAFGFVAYKPSIQKFKNIKIKIKKFNPKEGLNES